MKEWGLEPSYDVFQDRALARRLAAHYHNLRQIDGIGADGVKHILQLVDNGYELLHGHFCVCLGKNK